VGAVLIRVQSISQEENLCPYRQTHT